MNVVQIALLIIGVYLVAGVVFGVFFVIRGAGRIDPVARDAPLRVRLIFLPGAAALWPLLLSKWRRAGRAGQEAPS